MKAVIIEIRADFAAALSDDGSVTKIKNHNYTPGQIIEIKQPSVFRARKLAVWAASAAAVFMLGSVGAWAYVTPYTYVSLDVNPSIEYSLNLFDRVLSVRAVNDDGNEILNQIELKKLKNKTIQDAISKTVEQIASHGYFDDDLENGLIVTTSGKDMKRAEKLADNLKQSLKHETAKNDENIEIEAISVAKERVEEANELDVTPGKLHLVEKLQQSAPDPSTINIDEWLGKPVKEIMQATKKNTKAAKVQSKESKETDSSESDGSTNSPASKNTSQAGKTDR